MEALCRTHSKLGLLSFLHPPFHFKVSYVLSEQWSLFQVPVGQVSSPGSRPEMELGRQKVCWRETPEGKKAGRRTGQRKLPDSDANLTISP